MQKGHLTSEKTFPHSPGGTFCTCFGPAMYDDGCDDDDDDDDDVR